MGAVLATDCPWPLGRTPVPGAVRHAKPLLAPGLPCTGPPTRHGLSGWLGGDRHVPPDYRVVCSVDDREHPPAHVRKPLRECATTPSLDQTGGPQEPGGGQEDVGRAQVGGAVTDRDPGSPWQDPVD